MERAAEHEDTGGEKKSSLYVVATPIGNLADVTLRALDVLRTADVIAAEDTRVTTRLLNHYGIRAKQLLALHEHNEQRSVPRVLAMLRGGHDVALVSDAGTPGISDPGARLVAAARDAGFSVVPVPGPNAAAAAISAAGMVDARWLFVGFLPAKAGERRRELEALQALPYALVFYEAPHRVFDTVDALTDVLGGARRIVIARELTKMFESIHGCTLADAGAWLRAVPAREKGEFVLIVEGAQSDAQGAHSEAQRVLSVLLDELPLSQAASLAAKLTGGKKNELYALALEMRQGRDSSMRRDTGDG